MILIGAASLAALIGNTKDALVILAVVLINASVGFYQDYRAEQSLAALKSMLPVKARVRRDRQKIEIPAKDLVPGDVVLLEAGDPVPADGRLVLAAGLEVDESTLTGESLPQGKQTDCLQPADLPLAERSNMVYMNTLTGVIVLQAVAVHWPPAQVVFGTEILSIRDWGIATGVASSILLLEEGRKLMVALFARVSPRTKTPNRQHGSRTPHPEQ